MNNEKFKTTVEEVSQIVYDTDVYENIKKITEASEGYDISFLFFKIVVEINTNYLSRLKECSMKGERREYLIERIESELRYYVMHRKK
jgi:hypothetical protein